MGQKFNPHGLRAVSYTHRRLITGSDLANGEENSEPPACDYLNLISFPSRRHCLNSAEDVYKRQVENWMQRLQ